MELAMRKDVPVEETWDLSLIYKTEEEFEKAFEEMQVLGKKICEKYQGKLTDAETITACLAEYEKYSILSVLVGSYAGLAVEVDYYDTAAMERYKRVTTVETELQSHLTFIYSEIIK